MFRHLEDLKKRQNKEDLLNKKQAKKRAEAKARQPESEIETPSKVKRVEVEIDDDLEKEVNVIPNDTVGKYCINIINLSIQWCVVLFNNIKERLIIIVKII